MDLIAALGLVMVIEGLALAIFSTSVPALLATLDDIGPAQLRGIGIITVVLGAVVYLLVRGGPITG